MGKIKLSKEGIQGFFIRHVEKIVLGVVMLLLGVFVYSGYSLEGLPATNTPDKLIQNAKSAKEHVVNPENWKNISTQITIPTGHRDRVAKSQVPTVAALYASDKPLEPAVAKLSIQKRKDPALLAPEKLEVTVVTGPVAYLLKRGEEDLLAKEPNSSIETTTKKKTTSGKKKKGDDDIGAGLPGMPAMPGNPGMPGMPGMPGQGGLFGGADAGDGSGMAADANVILANAQDRIGFQAGPGAIARSQTCVAVKALVPWKKQYEEFERAFSSADGYNPARDAPRFLSFSAQRAEVGDDPNAPLEWTLVAFTKAVVTQLQTEGYYGFPQEIADPRYLYPLVLTMPVPPLINRDPEKLALHSEVPRLRTDANVATQSETDDGKSDKSKDKSEKPKTPISDDPSDLPSAAGGVGGSLPGGATPDGGMAPGGMMPGGMMPGGMMPGGMAPGGMMPGGMAPGGMMPGGMAPGGMMPGGMMPGGMMPGGEGGGRGGMAPGSPGGAGDFTSGVATGPQVPYIMIRFFDFNVEVGKKYQYRVQVILEDPNHPQDVSWEPSERFLDDSVKKRLSPVSAEEQKKKSRIYYLRTDFSQPSDVVTVTIDERAVAGKISAGRFTDMARETGTEAQLQIDEPTGKFMVVSWDEQRATDVPGILDVSRGTFLNFDANADVIHPVLLVFKRLANYSFRSDLLVADIRGGESLPSTDKNNPLHTLGEYAVVDEKGQLRIHNELTDWDDYRKLTLPEIPATPAGGPAGAGGEDGGGMMPGGMMPGGMMPGDAGGGKKGGRRGKSDS